jgi:hypothetical protein
MPATKPVNEFQKAVLLKYADGDVAHLATINDQYELIKAIGKNTLDGHLIFLMTELHGAGSLDDALLRMTSLEDDARTAITALGGLVPAAELR